MIMVLPEQESFSGKVGKSLGQGFSDMIGEFLKGGERRKSDQLKKSLKSLETTFHPDYELTPQEQLLNVYYALADRPDVAASFASKIAPFGLQKEKSFFDQLFKQHEQDQLNKAIGKAQEIYENKDYSPEQKIFGMQQALANHPNVAKNLFGSLKSKDEGDAGDVYSAGYNAIVSGDMDAFQDILNDPHTPLQTKKDLVTVSNQIAQRKSVQDREIRNRQTLIFKSYNDAINQELKLSEFGTPAEQAESKRKIKRLENLRKKDMATLLNNPESYHKLHLWEHLNDEFLPEEEEEPESVFSNLEMPTEEQMGMKPSREPIFEDQMVEETFAPQGKAGKRVRFDPNNPVHVERANELLQLSGNDPEKFNALMAQEFE